MAVPQRRISKTRKRLRRTHFKLEVSGLVTFPNCGEMIKSHRVCPKCGYYAGKETMKNGRIVKAETLKKEAKTGKKSTRRTKKEEK